MAARTLGSVIAQTRREIGWYHRRWIRDGVLVRRLMQHGIRLIRGAQANAGAAAARNHGLRLATGTLNSSMQTT